MHDPFVGTWTLNPSKSLFDRNHRPSAGTMTWQLDADGAYRLLAEGLDEKGQPCVEQPQRLVPDGKPYPVAQLPGLNAVTSRPDPRTLHGQVTREDGSIAGEGRYVVSPDGTTLTASTTGFDSQLRRFDTRTVWDRV
jgi:hypothetical protein